MVQDIIKWISVTVLDWWRLWIFWWMHGSAWSPHLDLRGLRVGLRGHHCSRLGDGRWLQQYRWDPYSRLSLIFIINYPNYIFDIFPTRSQDQQLARSEPAPAERLHLRCISRVQIRSRRECLLGRHVPLMMIYRSESEADLYMEPRSKENHQHRNLPFENICESHYIYISLT